MEVKLKSVKAKQEYPYLGVGEAGEVAIVVNYNRKYDQAIIIMNPTPDLPRVVMQDIGYFVPHDGIALIGNKDGCLNGVTIQVITEQTVE
jgi:hypothetical protein